MSETPGASPASEDSADSSDEGSFSAARQSLALAIRRGEYAPNQRLVESELTQSLGVSRGTVRAVFIALEQENYISLERNRGARVRQFSPSEALEILQTREILESAAAGLAAERITPDELVQVDEIFERMLAANDESDGSAYSHHYRELHTLLIAASKQPTLIRATSSVPYQLVMRQYRDLQRVHPRPASLEEHRSIIAALKVGDRASTEATMRFHIGQARRALSLDIAAAGEPRTR